jgi:hypothetical protein
LIANDKDPSRLDQSIGLLKHTSRMVQLFTDKHVIYNVNDARLQDLNATLHFFNVWKQQIQHGKEFLSGKLWFDMQSMILGFISLVKAKLARFPGSVIKPAIMNQDLVENHFSQLRSANAWQNENPTYLLTQGTQNSIIFGQTTISKKSNTGTSRNSSFAELPKENLFSKKKTLQCTEQ